jgi:adenylosuccinate lyase
MAELEQLLAISPVDGRYAEATSGLKPIMSEYGLMKYRVAIEAGWLATLGSGVLPDVEPFGAESIEQLRKVSESFSPEDGLEIKAIESTTRHDVKAVELWLRQKLQAGGENNFSDYLEFIHFGCTSEDINNLAYGMMLRDARDKVLLPAIDQVLDATEEMATDYANIPLLSQTHGQPATPTTLGKEMRVFSERFALHVKNLANFAIFGKFNGAAGTYGAAAVAYPEVNWPAVNKEFVERLGLVYNPVTTQIEPHDWDSRLFFELVAGNTIATDMARDIWTYISRGVFRQQVVAGEVGSSTMPHKVNPIDFENAESNFTTASDALVGLARKLPISRLQRDLSDSSSQRAIGSAFGHTLIAYKSLRRGLGKISPDTEVIARELWNEWALLGEAVQTVMRRYGVEGGYEMLKQATRGSGMDESSYFNLVRGLPIPENAKKSLLELTPWTYTGYAEQIARNKYT